MFELKDQTVKLASINPRAEIHGEERVPAFDLKIEAQLSSDVLIYFHSQLRSMLYQKNDTPDLIEQSDPEALTALRFPKMAAFKWEWEGTGYTVTVDYGMGGDSNIVLADCKIDGLRINPMHGGTVGISFRVICKPKTGDVGLLCDMIQQNIDITLEPPEATSAGELFKDAA
jgi:hypothetical protein